eukprot:scaffold69723_cov18-Tisochrysis_lutea.AAC.2
MACGCGVSQPLPARTRPDGCAARPGAPRCPCTGAHAPPGRRPWLAAGPAAGKQGQAGGVMSQPGLSCRLQANIPFKGEVMTNSGACSMMQVSHRGKGGSVRACFGARHHVSPKWPGSLRRNEWQGAQHKHCCGWKQAGASCNASASRQQNTHQGEDSRGLKHLHRNRKDDAVQEVGQVHQGRVRTAHTRV